MLRDSIISVLQKPLLTTLADFGSLLHGWILPVTDLAIPLILLAVSVGAENTLGEDNLSAALTTNSPFVIHLQNPPWIKEIHFRRTRLVHLSALPGKKEATVWLVESYKAAIQLDGFYAQRLPYPLPPPLSSPRYTNRIGANGTSRTHYWAAAIAGNRTNDDRSLTLEPQPSQPGASENNGAHGSIETYRQHLQGIRFLGFPELRPNSFQVLEGNRIKAVAADGSAVDGHILDVTSNQPMVLVYTNHANEFLVKYAYADNESLPYRLEISQSAEGKPTRPALTNWIDQVEYGSDNSITNGYPPSRVFSDMAKFNHIVVWSNGVDYVLGPHGDMFAINHNQPTQTTLAGIALKAPSTARGIMIAIIFASTVVARAAIRRAKNKST